MQKLIFGQDQGHEKYSRRTTVETSKERKWREIEAIMERRRLKQELQQLDCAFDGDLDGLEL
ncbi:MULTISPECIES: DUF3545 family protein [Oceanimonas]|uniref:DUF3545 domain-containing protein n=1 Tax=Oceanimonas doudoroffii TaxID=84158 RepID=A0A233REX7_9GAMM|nr:MULTISPECIES: DUF3545 family protein [Oceanimonas]OXY81954.1 hypothetical protein B6S08_10660 [Oceanimonas doudoroffii]